MADNRQPTTDTDMHGALILDKPSGPTSHDIVALARRALREKRIGHTGTLDPLATGVLVLLVGRATRLSQFLVSDEKEYLAEVRLGVATPTYDAASLPAGREMEAGVRSPDTASIDDVLSAFRGTFLQAPPPHSAKKIAGVRAYEKARKDEPVELKPVEVTVRELERVAHVETLLRLRIVCSSGFYVRSLAHDLGQALGCGAHLEALRRTRAGRFGLERSIAVESLANDPAAAGSRIVGMNDLLAHLPPVTLSEEGARRAAHGNAVGPEHVTGRLDGSPVGRVRLLDPSGALVAVAEHGPDAALHPLTVLV